MTPVTDPALLAQLNGSGSAPAGLKPVTDPALLQQLNTEGPGVLEAGARGAANNFPLAPQAIAALSPGSYSENLADWNSKAQAAKAQHPVAYRVGAVGGALAPLAIPGVGEALEAAPVLGNVAFGAANAVSNTNLVEHPVDALKEAAVGGALGGALGKGTQALGNLMEAPIKKFASYATSPEATAARLANPEAFKSAPALSELSESSVPRIAKLFDEKIEQLSDAARNTLSTSHYPEEGAVPKEQLLKTIAGVKGNLSVGGGGLIGSANTRAAKILDDIAEDVGSVGKNVRGTLKSVMGVPSIVKQSEFIPQSTIKDIIQHLDNNINWDDPASNTVNKALTNLRTVLDEHLKTANPAYSKAMEPLANAVQTRGEFIRKMALQNVRDVGYIPTDATLGKLGTSLKDAKVDTQRVLEKVKDVTGEDLKTPLLAQEFRGPTPESPIGFGSKVAGAGAGMALTHAIPIPGIELLGGHMGKHLLAEQMSKLGRGIAGSGLDAISGGGLAVPKGLTGEVNDYLSSKYGNAVNDSPDEKRTISTDGIVDHVLKSPELSPYKPIFEDAAKRGPQAITSNHFILMQRDPRYNQHFLNQGRGQ